MPVDDREKRQSAFGVLMPFRIPGIHPPPAGVDQAERQGAVWSYSGILAEEFVAPEVPVILVLVGSIRPL